MNTAAEVIESVKDLRGVEALLQRLRDELVDAKSLEQSATDRAREQYDRAESAVAELARVTADLEERTTNLALAEAARDDLQRQLDEAKASLATEKARADAAELNGKAWEGTAKATMDGAFDVVESKCDPLKIGDCFRWIGGKHHDEIGEVTEGPIDQGYGPDWRLTTGDDVELFMEETILNPVYFKREPAARPALSATREGATNRAAASPDLQRAVLGPAVRLVDKAPTSLIDSPQMAAIATWPAALIVEASDVVASPPPAQASSLRPEKRPLRDLSRAPKEPGPPPMIGFRSSSPLAGYPSAPRAIQAATDITTAALQRYLKKLKLLPGRSRLVGGKVLDQTGQRLHACQAVIKVIGTRAPEQVDRLAAKAKLSAADAGQAVRDLEGAGLLGKSEMRGTQR